jgi:hypothetical protein
VKTYFWAAELQKRTGKARYFFVGKARAGEHRSPLQRTRNARPPPQGGVIAGLTRNPVLSLFLQKIVGVPPAIFWKSLPAKSRGLLFAEPLIPDS